MENPLESFDVATVRAIYKDMRSEKVRRQADALIKVIRDSIEGQTYAGCTQPWYTCLTNTLYIENADMFLRNGFQLYRIDYTMTLKGAELCTIVLVWEDAADLDKVKNGMCQHFGETFHLNKITRIK